MNAGLVSGKSPGNVQIAVDDNSEPLYTASFCSSGTITCPIDQGVGGTGNSNVGCPNSVTLTSSMALPLAAGVSSQNNWPYYLTGFGALTTMTVGPTAKDWSGAAISESLTMTSNSCPANFPPCGGGPPLIVGAGATGTTFGYAYPALPTNAFFDEHVIASTLDLLAGASVSSCTIVCAQTYSCNGASIGSFTITKSAKHAYISGASYGTQVSVSKQ